MKKCKHKKTKKLYNDIFKCKKCNKIFYNTIKNEIIKVNEDYPLKLLQEIKDLQKEYLYERKKM